MDISAISSVASSPGAAALSAVTGSSSTVKGSYSDPVTAAQRQKAAAQFEAILVRQMLSKSVGSMMGGEGHTAGLMYGDLMTNTLAQNLTAGKGLGLGKIIETQLAPRAAAAAAKVVAKPITRE